MYDTFSSDYDRFMDWPSRLAVELPFIEEQLKEYHAVDILDAASGTGMHAIALAQHGFNMTGADISQGMVDKSRTNARSAGIWVRLEKAGFGGLASFFGKITFDAILCLGNSLSHVLSHDDLDATLVDFADCLKPRGMLLIQNRNFDEVIANHTRWMEPQSHSEAGAEWIFQRFYDFDPDGLLTFNVVILTRREGGEWTQQVVTSRMRPLLKLELMLSLSEAGFTRLETYGDMKGAKYDHEKSPNLVIVGRKRA